MSNRIPKKFRRLPCAFCQPLRVDHSFRTDQTLLKNRLKFFSFNLKVADLKAAIQAVGGSSKVVANRLGTLRVSSGPPVDVDGLIVANPSVFFDAVFIPGGADSIQKLEEEGDAIHFALEAFVHYKPIAASGEGVRFLSQIGLISGKPNASLPEGVVTSAGDTLSDDFKQSFISDIAMHRFFNRERTMKIPA